MTSYDFKKKVVPHIVRAGIGLGIGLLVILLTQDWVFEVDFLKNVESLTVDYRFQSRYDPDEAAQMATRADVVIVGISDADLQAFPRRFPFPRDYYAHLIENINKAGARAIVFDITFESPAEGDTALAEVLSRPQNFNVVLATKVQTGQSSKYAEVRSIEKNYNNVFYRENKNIGIGIVNIIKDRDEVCRRYRSGGAVGKTGSLDFIFTRKGIFRLPAEGLNLEELELELIDFGAEDIYEHEGEIIIETAFTDFGPMQKALEEKGLPVTSAELQRIPNTRTELTDEQAEDIENLVEKIEEDDDVQAVYHNMA